MDVQTEQNTQSHVNHACVTYTWDVAGLSHPGLVRKSNEDHFIVARFGRYLETLHSNIPAGDVPRKVDNDGYAFVVADGVGGHSAGEVASRSAISILWDLVIKTPDWIMQLEDERFVEEVTRRAKARLAEVDGALVEQGLQDPRLEGMATTFTMALTVGDTLLITHVGDSRAYLLRARRLVRLTRDHTLVQELIDQEVIRPQDVSTHSLRHVLTNALGSLTKQVTPEVYKVTLCEGDLVLLCTDGLSSYVDEQSIFAILSSADTTETLCQKLLDAALQAGGRDNITVALGRMRKCAPPELPS